MARMRPVLAAGLLLTALAQPKPTAIDQLNTLQKQAEAAAKTGDQTARIAANRQIFHLLNGHPDVLLALARAYAAAGDTRRALDALSQYADLGLADDAQLGGGDARYAALKNFPEYQRILARFRRNEAPVSLAEAAIALPDAKLLTEDIDYDAKTQSFLITSIREAKIVRVGLDGSVRDFAMSPDHWPMVALKIDAARGRVWATEVAFDGFVFTPQSAWGRSAVLCFDLGSGRLMSRIEGPPHTSLGDMALAENGDPMVSDGDGGGLYRVKSGTLTAIDTADFISPQTSALAPGTDRLFVPDYARGIAAFSLRDHHATWLNPDDVDKAALDGIDGLYVWHNSLIVTQNGTTPERVMVLGMDASRTHIISQKAIEQRTRGLGDFTHGVVVGDTFWFLANAGWDQIDEHGNVKPGAALTPARILRYDLDSPG
jgi:hypothetical protein